jgi:aminoglycoside phosphotransferase
VSFLGRPPAHLDLRPNQGEWKPANPTTAGKICGWVGISGEVESLRSDAPESQGYFRVSTRTGQNLFIKILNEDAAISQLEADRVARWLGLHGMTVSHLIEGFPKAIPGGLCALAYKKIEGRYGNFTKDDLSILGTALAKLHRLFEDCPWKNEIRTRGLQRHDLLSDSLKKLQKGGTSSGNIPAAALELLVRRVKPSILDVLLEEPQVVHGDLNYGNVLFDAEGAGVVFLDYEDTLVSWLSPLAELSFVIERFALCQDDETSLELSRSLIEAYVAGGGRVYSEPRKLADLLCALAVKSLLLLVLVEKKNSWAIPDSEWQKFIFLYHQAISRANLFEKIALHP